MKIADKNRNQFDQQSVNNFIDAEFISEKQNGTSQYFDLYHKFNDEPDFDCDFLQTLKEDHYEQVHF
ncbi:MAG: hypothetical protein ABI441_18340 [Flavobacterium sp.]